MSRIVLNGSPGNLYTLKQSDLPLDLDLRYSFWRYVDFRNFNLSTYNMNYMDIYDCLGGGATLPTNIRLLESHRTDWTGAIIPKGSLDNMMQDLIAEEMRQRSLSLTGRARTAIRTARNHLDYRVIGEDAYFHSWSTMVDAYSAAGIASPPYIDASGTFFADYPKLKATYDRLVSWYNSEFLAGNFVHPPSHIPEVANLGSIDLKPYIQGFGGLDRWATARSLEAAFPPYKFICTYLYPVIRVSCGDSSLGQEPPSGG